MRSLRKMERDHGWIHTLLEEAENERMVSDFSFHPNPVVAGTLPPHALFV